MAEQVKHAYPVSPGSMQVLQEQSQGSHSNDANHTSSNDTLQPLRGQVLVLVCSHNSTDLAM